MMKQMKRPLAVLALVALASCTGGGTLNTAAKPPLVPGVPSVTGGIVQQNFVGLGDSLTAGFQSGGLLGDPTVTNPISGYPGHIVPITQTNGFWALMYAQMNGIKLDPLAFNADTLLGSANSPLPLIKGPGLDSQIVVNAAPPPPFISTHSPCDAFNDSAYSATLWSGTRLNPAGPIADLGVPGITMHQAVAMVAPLTGPPNTTNCGYLPIPGDPTSGNLQSLVQGPSMMFYPILGQFEQTLGSGKATELSAAVSLHPKLVTVWLGANDLLDFIFSGEASPTTDTPAQFQADETSIVTQLQTAGAKVALADLPTVLESPQFFQGGMPANPVAQCPLQNYLFCALLNFIPQIAPALPPAQVQADAAGVTAGIQSTYGIDNGGYLTETGFVSALTQIAVAIATNPAAVPPTPGLNNATCNPPTTTAVLPGTGFTAECDFVNDTLASDAMKLNAGYNQITDAIGSSGSGVALVPINALFGQFYTGTAPGQFTINPKCCTLAFGGGLVSWDGLHPSNTGYAFVANAFIATANALTSGSTPLLTTTQIQGIFATDPYHH